jgi:hypothetical protein
MLENPKIIKILSLIAFLIMVIVNSAAVLLPINGITTAQISDSYPNLFTPAGITFSIWSIIYLLLGIYAIYQFINKNKEDDKTFLAINKYFIVSSIINSFWIFAWQYKIIWLSLILMIILLVSLIKISLIIDLSGLKDKNKLLTKIPFGIYFGWITIATIANVTVFLISVKWNGFGIPDQIWMIIILIVGLIISSLTAIRFKNIAYGLVPVWAYLGIYLKHTSQNGFNNQFPQIITTLIICLAALIGVNAYLIIKKKAI